MSGNHNHVMYKFKPFEYRLSTLLYLCYPPSDYDDFEKSAGATRNIDLGDLPSIVEIIPRTPPSPHQLVMSFTACEFTCGNIHSSIDSMYFDVCMGAVEKEMIPVTFYLTGGGVGCDSVFLSGEYLVSELKLIIAVMSRPTLLNEHLSKTREHLNDNNGFPLRKYIKDLN